MLSWIDIDAAALRHNYRAFVGLAGRERVAPVLKSNAYGHGLETVYRALESENPPWICVNYVEEAARLRSYGFDGRLLIVGPAVSEGLAAAGECRAELTVGNWQVLEDWRKLGPAAPKIHLKFDTGMSRQGFLPDEAPKVAAALEKAKDRVTGVATHFANVEDVTDYDYPRRQLKLFRQVVDTFRGADFKLLAHAASSASCLLLEESRFDLERIGISLYGLWPSQATKISYLQTYGKVLDLVPALKWQTRVTTTKKVESGQFIGYGCTFRANQDMRIAVLPVGYNEGYPRLAGDNSSYVLIHGQRCPLVGRICMNMLMVDITHLHNVEVGDVVTLIGTDGDETVHAGELAAWARTIHYELMTCLNPEIPRNLIVADGGSGE